MTVLSDKRIAFLATDGVEQVELTEPWGAMRDAGAEVVLVSLDQDSVQGFDHLTPADTFPVDAKVTDADPASFDALVLPGGVANPDRLRTERDAVTFVRALADLGKPIAAICHAPWLLIESGLARGRTLTSWPSLRTDLANAGATWVDEEVVTDRGVLTSRKPDDLPAFNQAAIRLFAGGGDDGQVSRGAIGAVDQT
ncbi:MAG: pfpI [Solirubrobacterales bacterium]|jgi:protease I|nr:pfpI [Solirubrobacterales bacterium]